MTRLDGSTLNVDSAATWLPQIDEIINPSAIMESEISRYVK